MLQGLSDVPFTNRFYLVGDVDRATHTLIYYVLGGGKRTKTQSSLLNDLVPRTNRIKIKEYTSLETVLTSPTQYIHSRQYFDIFIITSYVVNESIRSV